MKSILIVDDDPLVLAALNRVLRARNFNLYSVSSGDEALQIMREHSIHLVLSDYLMPNMVGTALLAKIAIKWPETQRLIISGHSDYDTVLKAIQTGVVHKFLAKPWSNNELLEHIESALQLVVSPKPLPTENAVLSKHQALNQGIHLQAILNTVRDGIVTYNKSGVILSVNQALLNCFSYLESDLIGMSLIQLIPALELDESIQASAKLVGRKKTGEVFPLEFTCSDMNTQGFDHQLGVIRDLTQWAVRETENKQLLAALDSCQDSYALFSASGHLIRCNQKFKEMYQHCRPGPEIGISYRTFLDDCVRSGLFPEAKANPQLFIDGLISSNTENIEQQYQLEGNKWIQIHQTRAENDCVISFHIDVSQSKRSQLLLQNALSEAQQANSARGRFLAMMSHEIRTPLNAVLGLLQVLRNTPLTERQLEYIATAESSGRSLLNIITDILDYSKIEANKLSINAQPCSLKKLADSILDMLDIVHNCSAVTLILDFDESIEQQVLVDKHRLRQILVNLLANSLKFTHSGEVTLKIAKKAPHVYVFSVIDTGIGIAPELQSHIFDEFTQARKIGSSGTGLGLAISQRLVKLLGAELQFTSTENIGSCFWFSLDLADAEQQPELERHWHFATGQPVLLVDDIDTNRLVAGEILKSSALEVSYASDGLEALKACKNNQFALILMDISMPKMDGLTATCEIRKLKNYQKVPIVALTAYAMEDERQKFLAIGMDDVIEKPLEKVLMLNTLAKYLRCFQEVEIKSSHRSDSEHSTTLFNKHAINKLAQDTNELILADLVKVFIKDLTQRLSDLQQISHQQQLYDTDLEIVERHFHSITSSSAIYGLQPLSAKASLLEMKIKREKVSLSQDMRDNISDFCQLAQQSMSALKLCIEQRYCPEVETDQAL